jgi:single-stranded-DNA-specific exonuclease
MFPVRKREWRKRKRKPSEDIERELGVSPQIASVFVNRGMTDSREISSFLNPSLKDLTEPYLIRDMKKAAERLYTAIKKKEKICIYGDYDADGLCASAILYDFLSLHGANLTVFVPHRMKHGYGFHQEVVEKLKAKGVRVIVTADCGINSFSACEKARNLGIDVIITDHHLPGERIPPAFAILDPSLNGSGFRDKNLCGAGVAFYLCIGLRKYMREMGEYEGVKEPNLAVFLDLVATATVVDVAPLRDENRIMTKIGLEILKKTKREGLRALIKESGLSFENLSTFHLSFIIGPRINAAGRISDPISALHLLLTRDTLSALRIAKELNIKNQERQAIEKEILDSALKMVEGLSDDDRVILLFSERWHPGVIGIVASKLVEMFHRPVLLGAKDGNIFRFSARSVEGVHITDILRNFEDYFISLGGHASAAGFVLSEEKLIGFKESVTKYMNEKVKIGIPFIEYDEDLNPSFLSVEDVKLLNSLEPFGEGNPEPVFLARNVRLINPRKARKGFLYTLVDNGKGYPIFSDDAVPSGEFEILYTPFINRDGKISLRLVDIRGA